MLQRWDEVQGNSLFSQYFWWYRRQIRQEYTHLGAVTEFTSSVDLGKIVQLKDGKLLSDLKEYGKRWNYVPTEDAIVFVDNHDNQRHEGGDVLNYNRPELYRLAWAFTLAHPYGTPCILSSPDFTLFNQGEQLVACTVDHQMFWFEFLRFIFFDIFGTNGRSSNASKWWSNITRFRSIHRSMYQRLGMWTPMASNTANGTFP